MARGSAAAAGAGASTQVSRRRQIGVAGIAAIVAVVAVYGLWARFHTLRGGAPDAPGEPIPAATGAGTSVAAVGRAAGLDGACTAWLLDSGGGPDAAAHAVTSGRCVGASDPAEVLADSVLDAASVTFRVFAELPGSPAPETVEVPIESVRWASTRGTDLAVLRLDATYADLASSGVTAIRPVAPAAEDTQILVAGFPVEGIPVAEQYVRGSTCRVGPTTDVLQAAWLWHAVQSVACTGILRGSQGSPVLNEAGEAVGMVTATTIGAPDGDSCTLLRPCEVSEDGRVRVAGDRSYVVPVGLLATCFADGELRRDVRCGLEEPASVVPARAESAAGRPGDTITLRGDEVPAGPDVRVKSGPLGEVDCRSRLGWRAAGVASAPDAQEPSPAPGSWRHEVELPEREGRVLVCVGSAGQPTEIVLAADGSPPQADWIVLLQTPVQGGVRVEPVLDPPELVRFRWVSGPVSSIDCPRAEGYVRYPGIPATIQVADLPSTVCVIGIDAAGNRSTPAALRVT